MEDTRAEALPIGALVALCLLLTVQAGTVFDYLERTTEGLLRSSDYSLRVLGEPTVQPPASHRVLP